MIKIYDAVCVYDKTLRFSWKLSGGLRTEKLSNPSV